MPRHLTSLISLIVAVRLAVQCGLAAAVNSRTAEPGKFRLRMGESFKITLFADLHFGEDAWTEWGPIQDFNSRRVMSSVLDLEQPDFVVYLGDVITANNMMVANASLYWDQAISPVRERGIPWCSVFGNHDDASFEWPLEWFSETGVPPVTYPATKASSSGYKEFSFHGTTRMELMRSEIEKHAALSYSSIGPKDLWPGVSNYVLKVSSGDSQLPVAYMYFFDSGGGSFPEVISNAQVKWFQLQSTNLNANKRYSELIFWHIPSKSFKGMAAANSNGNQNCVGSIFGEQVASQKAEMGIMQILEQRSSVKAVFVGHNHGLDWCCPFNKLWLCYARHTGYGGYGNWARGSRTIEIKELPFSLKTWITMENGTSHSEVTLSS